MDIATTSSIERIARVLAGRRLSDSADGNDPHASDQVDATWEAYRDDAISILKTLREPDAAMERAGDIAIWQRMIEAALGQTPDRSG